MNVDKIAFADIQKANETITTTPIERYDKKTGKTAVKHYAEVNQRIKAFRMVFPTGTIKTELIAAGNGVCTFRAKVTVTDDAGNERLLGTGTAQEKENSSYINKTSYIENCETSAVGRALGMAGFGIDTSIASFEEVTSAMQSQQSQAQRQTSAPRQQQAQRQPAQQMEYRSASVAQVAKLEKVYKGESLKKLLAYNNISKLSELSASKASELLKQLNLE